MTAVFFADPMNNTPFDRRQREDILSAVRLKEAVSAAESKDRRRLQVVPRLGGLTKVQRGLAPAGVRGSPTESVATASVL